MKVCLLSVGPPSADPADPQPRLPSRLASREGLDVVLALGEATADREPEGVRTAPIDELADEHFDVALALDWRATTRLYELGAERYALLVTAPEHRTLNAGEADRILATLALGLPLDLIAGTAEVAGELRALRPEARVFEIACVADGDAAVDWDAAAGALHEALTQIHAEPTPAAALLPRRLMADAAGAVTLFRIEFIGAIGAYERLERDEFLRAGQTLRAAYRSPRLERLRRAASPLVVRAKRRLGPGEPAE